MVTTFDSTTRPARRAGTGRTAASVLTLFLVAVVAMNLVTVGGVLAADAAGFSLESPATLLALTLLPQLTMFAVGYLYVTRRSVSVRVAVPSLSGVALVVGATAAVVALQFGAQALFTALGVSTADDTLGSLFAGEPLMLAAFVLLTLFVVAPAEELLFRGAIQGGLRTAFGAGGAILGGAILFGLMHLPQYLLLGTPLTAAVWLSLVPITVFGAVYGALYERTGNLLVPIAVHGLYNVALLAIAVGL
jgi:membrane protease YdiL (CAAX protease family)